MIKDKESDLKVELDECSVDGRELLKVNFALVFDYQLEICSMERILENLYLKIHKKN